MVACKIPNQLTEIEAAYIAGIIDGEGTITLSRKHRNENRQLAITISNTEMDLLSFILKTIGAGKITAKRSARPQHMPCFTYAIYNRQALKLLEQVCHHLRTYKARRSQLILRDYINLTPRNGKYSEKQLLRRQAFEQSVLDTKPMHETITED